MLLWWNLTIVPTTLLPAEYMASCTGVSTNVILARPILSLDTAQDY